MTRIASAFSKGKAFIPFITAGDPSLDVTEQLVLAMEKAGADIIELGIPFSDPMAEGPTIQNANVRALAGGTTPDQVIELVRKLRTQTQIPLIFMTYANVVFSRGTQKFLDRAADAGIDGLILADVPYEESEEFRVPCKNAGIDLINMVAPTSHERIKTIAAHSDGFLYCVSSLGVTGVRAKITGDIGGMVSLAHEASNIPCAVGFGISTPEQAHDIAQKSDGAIVGSAIVNIIAEHGKDSVPYVADFVKQMKQAVQSA